jgi:hypothetical protein
MAAHLSLITMESRVPFTQITGLDFSMAAAGAAAPAASFMEAGSTAVDFVVVVAAGTAVAGGTAAAIADYEPASTSSASLIADSRRQCWSIFWSPTTGLRRH